MSLCPFHPSKMNISSFVKKSYLLMYSYLCMRKNFAARKILRTELLNEKDWATNISFHRLFHSHELPKNFSLSMKLASLLEISSNRLEFWNKNGRKSLPWFYVKSVFWWWIDISDIPGRGWWYGGGRGMMLYEAVVWVDADPSGVPTDPQVWSLTQFYSVDFSKSRIDVKKVRFQQTHNQGLRQLLLTVSWDLCP